MQVKIRYVFMYASHWIVMLNLLCCNVYVVTIWFISIQLKAYQHELGCKNGLLNAKKLELKVCLAAVPFASLLNTFIKLLSPVSNIGDGLLKPSLF